MSERDAIELAGETPITVDSLIGDLARLGVLPGMTLLVHSSLSSLGWVCGGAVAVIYALEEVLGEEGTLVMPTHSGDLSDPKHWSNPAVPESWWQTIRETMPAYKAELTPTRGMGCISETFRRQSDVVRSNHPQVSFAARGPNARRITSNHRLAFGLGEESPLSTIYDLAGWILLLGVDDSCNTSLHLAEQRADYAKKKTLVTGAPVLDGGKRQWVEFQDLEWDADDFARIGEEFAVASRLVKRSQIGRADACLMPQQELINFASDWISVHR